MPFDFLLLGFAAWRLARMIVVEDGPYDVFVHMRNRLPYPFGSTLARDGALVCEYCTSVWTAAGLLLVWQVAAGQWLIALLAVSGLAMAIKELTEQGMQDDGD